MNNTAIRQDGISTGLAISASPLIFCKAQDCPLLRGGVTARQENR